MIHSPPCSTLSFRGHPIYAVLAPVPLVCFPLTLVTDIVYARTAAILWADMSAWLLVTGIVFALMAGATGLVDFLRDPRIRRLRPAWIHALGNSVALLLAIFNVLIHSRDAYTSVVPSGLILSGLVVVILLVTSWNGLTLVYRHGIGVRQPEFP
jgi:uncharacterized membrane protein